MDRSVYKMPHVQCRRTCAFHVPMRASGLKVDIPLRYLLVCVASCLILLLSFSPVSASADNKHPSVKIEITGIEGELLKNVKGYLRLYIKRDDPHFSVQWLKLLHVEAPEDIKKGLEPFGYFNPKIKSSIEKLSDNKWLCVYHVDPGPRVTVSEVDVRLQGEGAEDPDLRALVDHFPLKKGDYLDQDLYESAKKRIIQLALAKGYVDARAVMRKVLVNPQEGSAVIRLHVDTGPRYYLGPISIHQDFMDQGLIRHFIADVHEGEVFSNTLLLKLQQELSNTGYFNLVDVVPAFGRAKDRRVPVDITLSPADANRLSFGLGYDTEVGPNGSMHWHNARLNSYGHTADTWVNLSTKKNNLKGAYWIPAKDPRTDRYGIIARFEQEETENTNRHTADLEGGYYFLWRKWSSKLFTEGKFERFRTNGDSWTYTKMFSFGGRLERTEVPKEIFPTRGWYFYSELRASPGLISDTAYVREHLRTRVFLPAGERGRFLLRARLGMAVASDFTSYPNSLRFFAGGDESVRGYRWKELGPKDSNGDVIGGRNMMSATCEYDYRVFGKWVAALFADAGNAFNSSIDKVYVGTGVGVRWLSPVGSVRLDFAWPVNEDGRGMKLSSMKFYFGFEITM